MSPIEKTATLGLIFAVTLVVFGLLGWAADSAWSAHKRRKAARAGLARDAFFQSYEARLVEHWRGLTAGMAAEDAAALLDEIIADHRRRVAEGERYKAEARQAARVRLAGTMFRFEFPATGNNAYISEKPVFYTPEQMLKDQKEQQS
jgi:hypothetical protein